MPTSCSWATRPTSVTAKVPRSTAASSPWKEIHTLFAKLAIFFGQMRALINVEPRILRTDNETTFTAISDQLAAMGIPKR